MSYKFPATFHYNSYDSYCKVLLTLQQIMPQLQYRQYTHLVTVLRKVFNCWKSANLYVCKFVGCSIHLGNDGVLTVFVFFTKLIPDWR